MRTDQETSHFNVLEPEPWGTILLTAPLLFLTLAKPDHNIHIWASPKCCYKVGTIQLYTFLWMLVHYKFFSLELRDPNVSSTAIHCAKCEVCIVYSICAVCRVWSRNRGEFYRALTSASLNNFGRNCWLHSRSSFPTSLPDLTNNLANEWEKMASPVTTPLPLLTIKWWDT